ncbi:hypothetical protein CASFOL_027769 [Castilleja foliolosa]|uniref:F-box domain-containing protein n=1 Tax=Castilleja foliolosa TaxID=1961234 RepID=A0ABD3CFR9_9LAMI
MENNQPPLSVADALSDCVLPQDIMFCIVTRLPVKSIHRFKAVCKPWCKLFTTPKFMKMHHAQLSQNQSVMVLAPNRGFTFSLFDTNEKKPTNLADPFPEVLFGMQFIGCCNGLICVSFLPVLQIIELWNPALKLNKSPTWPKLEVGDTTAMVSLGFGYDNEGHDFKLVRIVVSVGKKKKMRVEAEVYSCNSDSWETIKVGLKFIVLGPKNNAIVNGNPYWVARADGNEVVVWFDMSKRVFNVLPLSSLSLKIREIPNVKLVDWKGSLAAIVCQKKDENVVSFDVWVFDDVGKMWSKNHTFGPIGLKVERVLQCFQNGKIIGECLEDGKLFVFDSENGGVKEIVIDGARKGSYQVYGYTESLAYFKGLAKEKVRTEEEELEIDKDVAGFFKRCLGIELAVPLYCRRTQ